MNGLLHNPVAAWIRSHRALVACVAVLCLLPAVHPGDIQWVGDEPMLIAGALRANLSLIHI